MGINPKDAAKDAASAARDIATHAVERSAGIVDSAAQILKGNVTEGTTNIVQDSVSIATHAVERVKEMASEMAKKRGDDEDVDEAPEEA